MDARCGRGTTRPRSFFRHSPPQASASGRYGPWGSSCLRRTRSPLPTGIPGWWLVCRSSRIGSPAGPAGAPLAILFLASWSVGREPTWIPAFACPECGSPLVARATAGASTGPWICRTCATKIVCRRGIVRFLSDARLTQVEPLIAQYRRVREQDGYRQRAAAYYRGLPEVARGDPQHAVWRIRRQSFRHLC